MPKTKWKSVYPTILLSALLFCPLASSAAELLGISGKIIPVHPGESIQQTINKTSSGSIILVSPGIFYETIRLKKGITLRSESGAKATIINGQNSAQPVVTGADQCVIEGFTIIGKGPAANEHEPSHAIECIDVSPIIKNNIIKNNQGTAIYVSGNNAAPEITGNIICSNFGAGIGNDHSSRATISGNECYGNARSGIGIRGQSSPLVQNNRSHHNTKAGIGVQEKGSSPKLKNNYCYFNKLSGVGVENGATPALEGNHLYSNGRCGLGAQLGSSIVLTGDIIMGNTLSGIGIMNNCQVTIKNSSISKNALAGITVTDDSKAEISHNTLNDNGTQGIVCSYSQADINHNTIDGNSHHGVAIYRHSKANIAENKIINNGAHDHRGAGIIVVSSNDVEINKNQFEGNYGPGVYAHKSSPIIELNEFNNDLIFVKFYASPMVVNNIFYSGKKAGGKKYKSGIDIREYSSPVIYDNQFYGKFGIAVHDNSRPLIINNVFSGQHKSSIKSGRSGIKTDKNSYPTVKYNVFYNGNKLLVGGKSVSNNITLIQKGGRFIKIKKNQSLEKLKDVALLILDNLFLK
jgi:parallel beta-helix repeat protein